MARYVNFIEGFVSFLGNCDREHVYSNLLKSIQLSSENSVAFSLLGKYLYEIEQDHLRASKCFNKAFNIDPQNNEEAGRYLVEILISTGKEPEAEGIVEAVLASNQRAAWAWKWMGIIQMVSFRVDQGIHCL